MSNLERARFIIRLACGIKSEVVTPDVRLVEELKLYWGRGDEIVSLSHDDSVAMTEWIKTIMIPHMEHLRNQTGPD